MDSFDLCAVGANFLVGISDIDTIVSLIISAIVLLALIVRYIIKAYTYFKDRKLTSEELKELKDDTDELLNELNKFKKNKGD